MNYTNGVDDCETVNHHHMVGGSHNGNGGAYNYQTATTYANMFNAAQNPLHHHHQLHHHGAVGGISQHHSIDMILGAQRILQNEFEKTFINCDANSANGFFSLPSINHQNYNLGSHYVHQSKKNCKL